LNIDKESDSEEENRVSLRFCVIFGSTPGSNSWENKACSTKCELFHSYDDHRCKKRFYVFYYYLYKKRGF